MSAVSAPSRKRGGIYPLILAGGSGTRFWPLSRRARPKQFLALGGARPLIVETARRLRGLVGPKAISIACGEMHSREIRRLFPGLSADRLLIEPVARNTAPAIGWAAMRVLAQDPNGVLVVLPSDHHVRDPARFRALLQRAARLCADGTLYTLGIPPTGPETGYGYLKVGASLPGGARVVQSFVEKPVLAKAKKYLASGNYLWNSGIFVFRADALLAEIRRSLPELAHVLAQIAPAVGTRRERQVVQRLFPRAPSISIDYGVMEKAPRVATLPADVGWSDLGSFAALSQVKRADGAGNVTEGLCLTIDSQGCLAIAHDRPLVLLGVSDLVVVDAGDAVLVVPKARAQDVRLAVAALARRGLDKLL
jgi:mannose-1-phosphate guanylyltransferase